MMDWVKIEFNVRSLVHSTWSLSKVDFLKRLLYKGGIHDHGAILDRMYELHARVHRNMGLIRSSVDEAEKIEAEIQSIINDLRSMEPKP